MGSCTSQGTKATTLRRSLWLQFVFPRYFSHAWLLSSGLALQLVVAGLPGRVFVSFRLQCKCGTFPAQVGKATNMERGKSLIFVRGIQSKSASGAPESRKRRKLSKPMQSPLATIDVQYQVQPDPASTLHRSSATPHHRLFCCNRMAASHCSTSAGALTDCGMLIVGRLASASGHPRGCAAVVHCVSPLHAHTIPVAVLRGCSHQHPPRLPPPWSQL